MTFVQVLSTYKDCWVIHIVYSNFFTFVTIMTNYMWVNDRRYDKILKFGINGSTKVLGVIDCISFWNIEIMY